MLRVFAIFDSGTKNYSQPFFSQTQASASRVFDQLVNDGQSMVSKYPKDFSLFLLGDYDEETAKFTFETAPTLVVAALTLVREKGLKNGPSIVTA